MSVLLRGLKKKPFDITAVVTVGDDGGSSGRLREEFQVPPPGDIRNVLLALSDSEPSLEKLVQHRFSRNKQLNGHSLGNLLLTAMTEIRGDFSSAVKEMQQMLGVKGNVLPVSEQNIVLTAETEDGDIIVGESNIPLSGKKIKKVSFFPETAKPSNEVLSAIRDADMIVFGPGSLYTSLIPNLLFTQVVEEINVSNARKVYVCNAMTQYGETSGYTAFQHAEAIFQHTGFFLFDIVIVNSMDIPAEILDAYEKKNSFPVTIDKIRFEETGISVVEGEFIQVAGAIRHDADKLSAQLEIILKSP